MVSGTVGKITTKTIKGRTYYGIVIKEGDELYRCGLNKPNVAVGDKVKFNTETTDYGDFVDQESLEVLGESKGNGSYKARKNTTSSSGGENWAARQKYWDDKEKRDIEWQEWQREKDPRIQYMAATNAAIEVVKLALEHECLALPKTANKRFDALMAYVEATAQRLNNNYSVSSSINDSEEEVSEEEIEESDAPDDDIPF